MELWQENGCRFPFNAVKVVTMDAGTPVVFPKGTKVIATGIASAIHFMTSDGWLVLNTHKAWRFS